MADLREIMRHLQFKSICVLVHNGEENPVLFVHSASPISDVLNQGCLDKVKIQRQHVLFFMLQPPYNLADVQAAFNLWVTGQTGFNAAVVHAPSDMLVVFTDESPVEQVPDCFNVALSFWGNVCPIVESQASENISIWVSGTWSSIQELNSLARALIELQDSGIVRIEVDEGWSQLRIRPRSIDDVVRVHEAATQALRAQRRKCSTTCNRVVLYQCALPLSPFEAEVNVSTNSERQSPHLVASLNAAAAALTPTNSDAFGKPFAYDVAMHLLSELNCEAILRHNYRYSFDVHGMKCVDCVRLILEELFLDRPSRTGYTHIALSATRNVMAVCVPSEKRKDVERHVHDCLSALGMSCTLIGEGPDLQPCEDSQTVELYNIMTRKAPSRPSAAATNTVGFCLRPDSVRCSCCAALLRSTLLRVVPGIVHATVECSSAALVVRYCGTEVAEHEIAEYLDNFGYQPTIFSVPANTAPQMLSVIPVSPDSTPVSSPTQYFTGGNVGPRSMNGQLNPYALSHAQIPNSSPFSPVSPVPHQCAETSEWATNSAGKRHVPLAPWKSAPTPHHNAVQAMMPGVTEDGSTVLVFNTRPKEGEAGIESPPTQLTISVPMCLHHRYTVWYDNVKTRVQLQQSGEADYTLTEVASFQTMPEFWSIWEQLSIEDLDEGSSLQIFRSDIPPDHNHPANKNGGRWFVRGVSTEPRIKLWTKLVLAMVSDSLTASPEHEVCGVVLSVKPSGDRIEIWVHGGYHQHGEEQLAHDRESEQYLPNILTSLLGDELGHRRFHFWTHAGFERHRKSHRGSVRRAKRHNKLFESQSSIEEVNEAPQQVW
jgi:hypothetical protein